MSMIEIRGLGKSFGETPVFHDISMDIENGDAIVLIGPSGCGKTTFLRCINRLEEPTGGSISFMGKNILAPDVDVDRLRAQVGMVYQGFNLFSHLNVLENMVLAPMTVYGESQDEAVRRAKELLETVGMENRMVHMPSQLSGGQKQRVAIVRCLMMKPEVLLFDEPTSALDPTMVDEVQSVIGKLVGEGMTSVIVTHEMDFARNVATKVVYFDEGGLYETGTPDEIFDHPQRPKTRAFVEKLDVFERVIREGGDMYALTSEIRAFCIPYGFTNRQIHAMELLLEEVGFAILRAEPSREFTFRLRCSRNKDTKGVELDFHGLGADPLTCPAVDELGVRLLEGLIGGLESGQGPDGWRVSARI